MRRIGKRLLWIGNAGDLRDPRAALQAGVEAVVELADSESMAAMPRELVRMRFPLSDGGDNPRWLLQLAVASVAELLFHRIPTLICCSAGMSRSISIAAAAAAKVEHRTLSDVLAEVAAEGPADVSPGFLKSIAELDLK